jgi:hypothetical protein
MMRVGNGLDDVQKSSTRAEAARSDSEQSVGDAWKVPTTLDRSPPLQNHQPLEALS